MTEADTNRSHPAFDNILSRLSVRAQNCCRTIGVHTIQELAQYACTNDFVNVRNCGRKTALELNNVVVTYYPNYRQNFSAETIASDGTGSSVILSEIEDTDHTDTFMLDVSKALETKINDTFDTLLLSCEDEVIFSTICSKYPTALSFFEAITKSSFVVFETYPNLSIEKNADIWLILINVLSEVGKLIGSNRQDAHFIRNAYATYKSVLSSYKKQYNGLIISRIPQKAHPLINAEFKNICAKLSTRVSNVLNSYKVDYLTILNFLDTLDTTENIHHAGNKSYGELTSLFSGYKDFIFDTIAYPEETLDKLLIECRYPFLSVEQREYVYSFFCDKKVYPLFYILFFAINTAKDRETQMYNLANGITCEARSLNEIAQEFNLSRERVRQLVSKYRPKSLDSIISEFTVQQYTFLDKEIIDVLFISEIIENLEFSNVSDFNICSFAELVKLVTGHIFYDFGECKFLFSTKFDKAFDWKNAWEDLTRTLSAKTVEDVEIPIDIFLTNYILNSRADHSLIRDILAKIISINFDASIDENYIIHLQKNTIDIENELYNIIKEAKRPLSVEEITNSFFAKFPEQSNKAIATIKIFMINSDRIKSVGKTSTYTLSEWNFSTKTLRGLIAEILLESDVPLSLETIVDILETRGRSTSKNSINSSILSDTKYNFVKYKGGLVGLGSKTYAPIYEIQSPEAIARKSFNVRLKELINFVETYHHFPFSSKDETESSLYRWQRNIEKGIIDISSSQMKQYQDEVNKRKQYMLTSSEYAFSQKCADFKYFVSTEFELPNQKNEQSLYLWFLKARREAVNFEGKKAELFSELVDFLSQYGFTFE